ncbi:MAG: AMP-binding protein [Chloroflexi bacterium]|nr:AMP-binding protein [Chloroflexota bacterium]
MAQATRYTPELIEEYTRAGSWDGATLSDLWERNARDCGEREAIADSKTRLTWAEANLWIDRLALRLLESGITRDQVVVLQLPNVVELPLLRVACEKAGLVCLQALRNLRHQEMAYILRHMEATAVVIPWRFRDFDYFQMVQEIRAGLPLLKKVFVTGDDVPPGAISVMEMVRRPVEASYPPGYLKKTTCPATQVSLVAHTTGTTGLPKLVEHPACRSVSQSRRRSPVYGFSRDDVFSIIGPASFGPNSPPYLDAPFLGARCVMLERFDAEDALKLIAKERVTIVSVVPAQLAMMVRHPNLGRYDLSSVRYWWSAGASPSYEISLEVEGKMGGKIINCLGAVDFGGEVSSPPGASLEERVLTAGRTFDGTEIRLVGEDSKEVSMGEVGEIWGRGPSCVSGYYHDKQATNLAWPGGWYKMGDLGRWDDKGNLVVVGRKKDMIIRGGQNIYPLEVESLLRTHPAVQDAAIVGMPDPIMGERCCAYIVFRPWQRFPFDELVSFLKSKNIALYKLPERLEIIGQMPLAGEQKIDKKVLQGDIAEKLNNETIGHPDESGQ